MSSWLAEIDIAFAIELSASDVKIEASAVTCAAFLYAF